MDKEHAKRGDSHGTALLLSVAILFTSCCAVNLCPRKCRCDAVSRHSIKCECSWAALQRMPHENVCLNYTVYFSYTKLTASHNLTSLKDTTFSGCSLQVLTDIILDCNSTSEVDSNMFKGLVNLKRLSVSQNMIMNPHPATSANISKLQKIALNYSSLIYAHRELLKKNRHLQIFRIASNRIRILPLGLFKYNNNLTEVYVNGNEISFLSSQQFQHNPELKDVHIQENSIMLLHADTFNYNRFLLYVNLSHNRIHQPQSKTFQSNCDLKLVDLSKNKLEIMSVCQLHCLSEAKKIEISGNSLVCDNGMKKVPELCRKYDIRILGTCGSVNKRKSTRVFRGKRPRRMVLNIMPLSENTNGSPSSAAVVTNNHNDVTESPFTEETGTLFHGNGHKTPTYGPHVVSDNGSVTMNKHETVPTPLPEETGQNLTTVVTLVEYNSPLVVRESTVRGFLFIGAECLLACAFVVRKFLCSKDLNDSTVVDKIELLSECEPKSEGGNETENEEV